jgi:hypothetical protein
MAREISTEADLRFEGFASYPNSGAFEPSTMLEYASNIRISEGVITPRKGSYKAYTAGHNVTYAVAAHGKTGDSILLFGANERYTIDGSTHVSLPALATKRPVRGQGYADALCMESADADFVAGGNIVERLVTARNDQLSFTFYGGVEPIPADNLSLVQCTYDPIQAVITGHNSVFAFGKRSIYAVKAGMGYVASQKKPDSLHQVQKLSSQDGVAGPNAVAELGGVIAFFDVNREPGIKIISGGKINEGSEPMSNAIKDIIQQVNPSKYSEIHAVGHAGRFYFSLPFQNKWKVLVLNPSIKGMFESLDEYPFNPNVLMVARKDGIPRLWAFDTQHKHLYLLEDGSNDSGGGHPVSEIRSRSYQFRTMVDKRYDGFYVHMDNADGAAVQIKAITVNPDSEQLLDQFSNASGSTIRRGLINKRAMAVKLKIIVTAGSPRILGMGVDGSMVGRSFFSIY